MRARTLARTARHSQEQPEAGPTLFINIDALIRFSFREDETLLAR